MTFNVLQDNIKETKAPNLITVLSSDTISKPVLLDYLSNILNDKSIYLYHAHELFDLVNNYYKHCYPLYIQYSIDNEKLLKLIQYSQKIVYSTDVTGDGTEVRVATESEVKNGIAELVPNITNILEIEHQVYLNLLLWTFTGRVSYYKKAGLKLNYSQGKIVDTEFNLIINAKPLLEHMIIWASTDNIYNELITKLEASKKSSNYKYPTFAKDEITPTRTLKKEIYNCTQGSYKAAKSGEELTITQREAKSIIFRIDKYKYKPSPLDISIIRKASKEYLSMSMETPETDLPIEVKKLIEKIEEAELTQLIRSDHFVFRVIDTLKRSKHCSTKQFNVLENASAEIDKMLIERGKSIINNIQSQKNKRTEGYESIEDISNMLGQGTSGSSLSENIQHEDDFSIIPDPNLLFS